MKNKFGFFLLVSSLIAVLGCATYGPVKSGEFDALVKSVLPADAGPIVFSSPAVFYPNIQGFSDIKRVLLERPVEPFFGVLVIAEDGIFFEVWDKSKSAYFINFRIMFDEMKSVSLDKFAANRRFTIQKKDQSFQAIAIAKANKANTVDTTKTEEAYTLIQKRIVS